MGQGPQHKKWGFREEPSFLAVRGEAGQWQVWGQKGGAALLLTVFSPRAPEGQVLLERRVPMAQL